MLTGELRQHVDAVAATVTRLVDNGKSKTAASLIDRVLAEIALKPSSPPGPAARPYLLNFRGAALLEMKHTDAALRDFSAAVALAPDLLEAAYNQGLCHKRVGEWASAEALMERVAAEAPEGTLRQRASWNWMVACAAQGRSAPQAKLPPSSDLGLAVMGLPTQGTQYTKERSWVQRLDLVRARILSVPRFGAPCQFGDVVLCDLSSMNRPAYGIPDAAEEEIPALEFLNVLESGGYEMHQISGGTATPAQAMVITEICREAGFHIEVWSVTMSLPHEENRDPNAAAPVSAGLVVTKTAEEDRQGVFERAVAALRAAERQTSVPLYSPTLMEGAGDELGARRHRKLLKSPLPQPKKP